ncbi:MAG: type III polyketide synthase [Pseudomonadota bacterium]
MNRHAPADAITGSAAPIGAQVYLTGLGTAVPAHALGQEQVAREAADMFSGRYAEFDRLQPVFESTGIETRYSVRPFSWFRDPHDWADRTEAYLEGGEDLFLRAAQAALDDAGLEAACVDAVVTVSSTGIATPSLEARAMTALGLRADVLRVPVFGLGCAGGVTGLAIARDLAASAPGRVVLLVAVELCTLAFRTDKLTKANVVATALFGDGAASAVLVNGGVVDANMRSASPNALEAPSVPDPTDRTDAGAGPLALGHARQVTWPGTLDIMGWDVDPVGFGAIFSRSIPTLVHERMGAAADTFLTEAGLEQAHLAQMIFHPGGTRVLEALTEVFSLAPDVLAAERDVLREFGNMSAPTVLFVLKRKRDAGVSGNAMMGALGPGFTASFLALDATADGPT